LQQRVLVVDDNQDALNQTIGVLAGAGYRCVGVTATDSAREVFNPREHCAVIVDLCLAETFGWELIDYIRKLNPLTVIIVIGPKGAGRRAIDALKIGADEYLKRPIDRDTLISLLGRNLDRVEREIELQYRSQWPGEVIDHWMGRILLDAPAALIHVDPTDIIRVANRAASRLLGKRPQELTGEPLCSLLDHGIGERWIELLRREAATPKGFEGEVHLRRGNEWFPAYVNGVERPDKGHLLISFRDLTRQKTIEQQFFESKRLASLGRVVEGVAHEVRNPLISIGGFARKLLKGTPADTREHHFLDIILKEVERLEAMVNDIEKYVEFASNRPHEFISVDIVDVVNKAYRTVSARYDESRNITESINHPQTRLQVYGDPKLLTELFEGLIENAYEAMPKGGKLDILVEAPDGWITVTVSDTGVGMEKQDLDEIFDPFFTSKTNGAGLGLAKAYMIAEDHSGQIKFDSAVGRGTSCTVTLPIDRRRISREAEA